MLIAVLVFVGVFAVIGLLLFAFAGGSGDSKQTLAHLQAALSTNAPISGEQAIDVRKTERFSAIPWMNRRLQNVEIVPRLGMLLRQANLNWTVGGLILMVATATVIPAYLVYLRTEALIFGVIVGLVCGYLPIGYVLYRRTKRFNAFEESLPEALDLMVSGLRAGHSLVAALRLVAHEAADPIGTEFRLCFEEQNYGLELRTALENMVTRVPLQDLRIMATAVLIQKESGGNLAEVLEKTSQVIRERFKMKRQVRVHTAQGRLTGWILSLLPLALGCGLYLIDPKTMSILWTRKIGQELLALSVVMTIVGGLVIRKIVNMEV
ncbi:MAG TPA: type II secretion system F family protein [Acidobacteriaceae bacterium]|nr:type II secretion system F family protein [Acidobacteriaceae bacterium]